MKSGRNDPCPCGGGKKFKHCCMDKIAKQHADIADDIGSVVAMNPNLSIDEINVVLQNKMQQRNNQPHPDFCGLSPNQMGNWLYAPFAELQGVNIVTSSDLSPSPVMRYLGLILDEAMENGGSFKATSKGNLPTKIVKQASALLPEFAVAKLNIPLCISEFSGVNEDKFNALHYTRVLAEIAGIIYHRSGCYHVKKAAQVQYQTQGIGIFFKPMLEAAISKYNWGYLDGFEQDIDLRLFWLFMLWRIQSHADAGQLIKEVMVAFPDVLKACYPCDSFTLERSLRLLIESRFIERFLQYWGFVTHQSTRYLLDEQAPQETTLQPLLAQTFQFTVK
ncbi:SEC-C domain-containing protein [Shewanella sp. A25]|nr:SEC-C domain-containing protein [Shewanella shenzhenensis]